MAKTYLKDLAKKADLDELATKEELDAKATVYMIKVVVTSGTSYHIEDADGVAVTFSKVKELLENPLVIVEAQLESYMLTPTYVSSNAIFFSVLIDGDNEDHFPVRFGMVTLFSDGNIDITQTDIEKSKNKVDDIDNKNSVINYPSVKGMVDYVEGALDGYAENKENKTNDIELDKADTEKYPSAKGVADYIDNQLALVNTLIEITSTDGVNYTAVNEPNVTLRDGLKFAAKVGFTSSGPAKLDAFGSGSIDVKVTDYGYAGTGSASASLLATFLQKDSIVELIYDQSKNMWISVSGIPVRTLDVSASYAGIRNIYAGTSEMVTGSTELETGRIYLVYE